MGMGLRCRMQNALLPGLSIDLIKAAYAKAPGNEIDSGKFVNPASSAALAANTFGFFLTRSDELPSDPFASSWRSSVQSIELEATIRLPWSGGRHPCLDVLITTGDCLIGIESKRYEPFRSRKSKELLSKAYDRHVWGDNMIGFERVRDRINEGQQFRHLDAVQLVKHAFGLRSEAERHRTASKRAPILVYLYAQPMAWPDGMAVSTNAHDAHLAEILQFAKLVERCEVDFRSCSYREVLHAWRTSGSPAVVAHVDALMARFDV